MIVLFSDYGMKGPYTAQLCSAVYQHYPRARTLTLLNDVPSWNVKAAAFLLAAYRYDMPQHAVFLCVVDPGVGTARRAVVVNADDQWFVGPDNGLFSVVIKRAACVRAWSINFRPARLSATFHGRDLFAPVAAIIERDGSVPGDEIDPKSLNDPGYPSELYEVIYFDSFGNALTGLRASMLDPSAVFCCGDNHVEHARTYGDTSIGAVFWYENANGLIEFAVNQGSAETTLGLRIGDRIALI
ncbi:MAG: S-adenosyl-l-methionine hydroxide adenosyltransferase family protein [Thiotrichales bacterium]